MNPRYKWAIPALAVAIAVVGCLGVGVAYAAWTATFNGSSQAKATTAQALTVTGSTGANALFPNMANANATNLTITITNPNPYNVAITALSLPSLASGVPVDASSPAAAISGCTTATQQQLSYLGATSTSGLTNVIAANGGTLTLTVQSSTTGPVGKLKMGDSDNNCQGAIFNLTPTVTGASTASAATATTATITF